MSITYTVDGVGGGGNFASLNDACTEVESNHDWGTDGMAYISIEHSGAETNVVSLTNATGTPVETAHLQVKVHADHRHAGVYTTDKWRLETSGSSHNIQITSMDCSHWIGLQVKSTSGTSSQETVRGGGTSSFFNLFEKTILWHAGTETTEKQHDAFYLPAGDMDLAFFDCVIIQNANGRCSAHAQNYSGSGTMNMWGEHCTVHTLGKYAYGGLRGASATTNVYLWNCVATSATVNDYEDKTDTVSYYAMQVFQGNGCVALDTSTSQFTAGSNNVDNAEWADTDTAGKEVWVEDLTSAPYDLTLKEGDNCSNVLVGASVTGSKWQSSPTWHYSRCDLTKDIAGNDRPGTWTDRDIGAFQTVASGPSIAALMNSHRQRYNLSIG